MEFDKSRIYGAVNADELKPGDKVIVSDCLRFLRQDVKEGGDIETLKEVLDESHLQRFKVMDDLEWGLAYLVERSENCTNCKEGRWDAEHKKILCDPVNCGNGNVIFKNQEVEVCEYWKPKTKQKVDEICINCEHYSEYGGYCGKHDKPTRYDNTCPDYLFRNLTGKMCLNCKHYNKVNDFRDCTIIKNPTGACLHYEAEKKYRPFKDTDELIEEWDKKLNYRDPTGLAMPYIWVKEKQSSQKSLITAFGHDMIYSFDAFSLNQLFEDFEFIDGSPCGVEA